MVTAHFWLLLLVLIMGVKAEDRKIIVEEKGDNLHVKCVKDYILMQNLNRLENGTNMGSLWNDPRGIFYCWNEKENVKDRQYIHVYVRRCMNCIELNASTLAGFIVADAVMIFLIASAVYFVSGSEIRRPGRASDKQNLIEKEGDYQMLAPRDNEQYSHLAPRSRTARGGY